MKQLTLPLGWPDDSKVSAQPRTLTLLEYLLSDTGLLTTLTVERSISDRLFSSFQQRHFSGPSWRLPSVLWLGLPLQHRRRDGSLLFPTLHTTLELIDFARPRYTVVRESEIGAPVPQSFGSGVLRVAESFPASSPDAKPKSL